MSKELYSSMTLVKLREVAKELEIKNISKFKKDDLVNEILKYKENKTNTVENKINKDGVILQEKISPKTRENKQLENQNSNYSNNNYSNSNYGNNNRSTETGFSSNVQTVSGILEIQESNSFGFLEEKTI